MGDTIAALKEKQDTWAATFAWVPKTMGDYTLHLESGEVPDGYRFFYYENERGCRWEALYDAGVGDYTVHVIMPLFEFTDINFSLENLDNYLAELKTRLVPGMTKLVIEPVQNFTYAYKAKGLDTWNFEKALPPQVGEYVRDIDPSKAIRMINGSFIIAEYVHPADRSGLLLFYNELRDEFFAELRRHNYPEINHQLDAKTIPNLEAVLEKDLGNVLSDLTMRL